MPTRHPCAALALALTVALPLAAQDPLAIARVTGPITIDGRVDEPAWQDVPTLPLTTYLPVAGQHPTDSSEVRLTFDDRYLYVSGRFFVSDPGEIQSTSLARDQLGPDDRFRIMLDSYNDNRTGVGFLVTPSGALSDLDMTDDGTISSDWNTYWDAAMTRDAHGWYAEMRIPFSSLRFHPENRTVVMGLIALRVSVKKNEWATFPALSPSMANALWRASVARKISFQGVQRRSPAYLTPYLLGGLSRAASLESGASDYSFHHDHTAEIGGDLKLGLTDDLTLDATTNTDFAQAEADNLQVNLTRFSLFFPEKRQFFLERAGSFAFNTGSGAQLFYSRQVGLAADGTPLRIYGGGRLVGRAGPLDLGAMDLQVAAPGGGSENLGVVRARHPVLGAGSYVGGIVTSRIGDGHHNVVVGADAVLRPFGNEFVTAQWTHSSDDRAGSGPEAAQFRLQWARRSSRGWIYALNGKWSGREFTPGLGFEPRSDYRNASLELDYNWITRSGFSLQPSLYTYGYWRNSDHALDSGELYPYLNFTFRSGMNGWIAVRAHQEGLLEPLPLSSSVRVPAGRHRYQQRELQLVSPTGAKFGYTLLADVGGFYDGHQTFVDISPTWSLSPHFTIGGEYQWNRISFPTRDERLTADVARLKLLAAWNTHLSLQALMQYAETGRLGVGNLRLRYRFSEGNDLYVVYNDQINVDRARLIPQSPELPVEQARQFLVKYTYTFAR